MFIEFIIPTYNRIYPLKCLLESLLCQTDGDWRATVIIDGLDNIKGFYSMARYYYPQPNVIFQNTEIRYNDYGHSLREIVKQKSDAEYVIMTGDDNYYTPNLVKEVKEAAINKPGFIYWDMVHSHFNYQYFKCAPHTHQIDMGAFATRTDLAKQIKLGSGFAADGDFVEDFNRKFPLEKKVKINKVLFVHN